MTVTIHLGADAHLYLPRSGGNNTGAWFDAPERVWVPWSDDLPTAPCTHEVTDVSGGNYTALERCRTCGARRDGYGYTEWEGGTGRPLAVGDVVTLTGDCPTRDGIGGYEVPTDLSGETARHGKCETCGHGMPDFNAPDYGRVSVAPARVAEILPVVDAVGAFGDFSDYEDCILSGYPQDKLNVYRVPTKLHRKGQETGDPLPDDDRWSRARWGIRLEVEATT